MKKIYYILDVHQSTKDSKVYFFDNLEKANEQYDFLTGNIFYSCLASSGSYKTLENTTECKKILFDAHFKTQLILCLEGNHRYIELNSVSIVDIKENIKYCCNFSSNFIDTQIFFGNYKDVNDKYEDILNLVLTKKPNLNRKNPSTWFEKNANQFFSENITMKFKNFSFYNEIEDSENYICLGDVVTPKARNIKIEIEINVDDNYDNEFLKEKIDSIAEYIKHDVEFINVDNVLSENFDDGNDNYFTYKYSMK